jgi:hypothetical protein
LHNFDENRRVAGATQSYDLGTGSRAVYGQRQLKRAPGVLGIEEYDGWTRYVKKTPQFVFRRVAFKGPENTHMTELTQTGRELAITTRLWRNNDAG